MPLHFSYLLERILPMRIAASANFDAEWNIFASKKNEEMEAVWKQNKVLGWTRDFIAGPCCSSIQFLKPKVQPQFLTSASAVWFFMLLRFFLICLAFGKAIQISERVTRRTPADHAKPLEYRLKQRIAEDDDPSTPATKPKSDCGCLHLQHCACRDSGDDTDGSSTKKTVPCHTSLI